MSTNVVHPSSSNCVGWVAWENISGQILLSCVDVLLIIRVYALYGKNKVLLAILIVFLLCEAAAMTAIIGISIPRTDIIINPFPSNLHVPSCLTLSAPPFSANYWIPGLTFQSILFLFVAIKFVQTRWNAGTDSPPILTVLARDGTWVFAIMFGILLWMFLSSSTKSILERWVYSVLGICGSRLVLNLRSAALADKNWPYDVGTVEMLTVEFRVPGSSGIETT